MASSQQQTGLFFMGANPQGTIKEFPAKYNSKFAQQIDLSFLIILGICSLFLIGTFFTLSLRPLPEVSEQEILKIQERYAKLVLNQPKKEVEEAVKKAEAPVQTQKKEEVKEEKKEDKIDRKNESVVEKEQRKEDTKVERKKKREEIKKRVQASGIFAAITAAGSGVGTNTSAVTDLLGTASKEIGDIGEIDISKGSFATKNVTKNDIMERRGEKTTGVGIEKESVGKAEETQIASSGSVNITSEPAEIKGESASSSSRSQAAINRVVNRQQSRLKKVYEAMLKRDPKLSGKLVIKFTILPDGSVTNVSIVSSTTNNSTFDNRILSYIKRWTFPPISGGGSVEVTFPFAFTGST
jgi:TonB family protein